MKRRSFLSAIIGAVLAPVAVATPVAAPTVAVAKVGRGLTSAICHVDEAPFMLQNSWGNDWSGNGHWVYRDYQGESLVIFDKAASSKG